MRKQGVSAAAWLVAGLVAAGAGGGPQAAGQSATPKGVFEEGRQVGVKFQVLRERDGELRRVATTYPFRSGDRFKFEVETNRSVFVYVLNRTLTGDAQSLRSKGIEEIRDDDRRDHSGSRRQYRLLYPGGGSRPAAVPAGRRVQFPPGDDRYFVMDDQTGIEKIYLLASERRIDLSGVFRSGGRPPADRASAASRRLDRGRRAGPVERTPGAVEG